MGTRFISWFGMRKSLYFLNPLKHEFLVHNTDLNNSSSNLTTHCIYIDKTDRLLLLRVIVSVYCENILAQILQARSQGMHLGALHPLQF
jgi:hypothetical protein